jgi:hypothetical protein
MFFPSFILKRLQNYAIIFDSPNISRNFTAKYDSMRKNTIELYLHDDFAMGKERAFVTR